MKKQKLVGVSLAGMIFLAACGKSGGMSQSVSNEPETTELVCAETETSEWEKQNVEEVIEADFAQVGITEYEKIDLSVYEEQAGIPLSEEYLSYRFFLRR